MQFNAYFHLGLDDTRSTVVNSDVTVSFFLEKVSEAICLQDHFGDREREKERVSQREREINRVFIDSLQAQERINSKQDIKLIERSQLQPLDGSYLSSFLSLFPYSALLPLSFSLSFTIFHQTSF